VTFAGLTGLWRCLEGASDPGGEPAGGCDASRRVSGWIPGALRSLGEVQSRGSLLLSEAWGSTRERLPSRGWQTGKFGNFRVRANLAFAGANLARRPKGGSGCSDFSDKFIGFPFCADDVEVSSR
jgi:hypothetical protein